MAGLTVVLTSGVTITPTDDPTPYLDDPTPYVDDPTPYLDDPTPYLDDSPHTLITPPS